MIFAKVSLFAHVIYSSAELQVSWRINDIDKEADVGEDGAGYLKINWTSDFEIYHELAPHMKHKRQDIFGRW